MLWDVRWFLKVITALGAHITGGNTEAREGEVLPWRQRAVCGQK